MKNTTNIGIFAAIVFAVGMAGITISGDANELQSNTYSSSTEGAGILGHIEIVHTNSEGKILSYQQTDNMIVTQGRNCTAMLLFGTNTGCDAATAGVLGKYTVIGLGNGTALAKNTALTDLSGEILASGGNGGDGLSRTTGTLDPITAATTNATSATQRIFAVFSYNGSLANNAINQAGLFNSTSPSTDSTFALKNFPSAVSMNNGDQLTVNWDITISGSNDNQ